MTARTGLVSRSERSARRTRSSEAGPRGAAGSSASSGSPAPKVAWISGANVSMSGHMTMTSRGSRVGSACRLWRIASRSTSTWRPAPWQAWTWMLESGPAPARVVGARSARTSACSRASSDPGLLSSLKAWSTSRTSLGARASTICSSRPSRPQEASSRFQAGTRCRRHAAPPARRGGAGRRQHPPTRRTTAAGETSGRRGRRRPVPAGSRGGGRAGSSGRRARGAAAAASGRGRRPARDTPPPVARPGRLARCAHAAAATGAPASGRRPRRVPAGEQLGAVERVAVIQRGEVSDDRSRRERSPRAGSRCARSCSSHGSARCVSTVSKSGQTTR